MGTGFTTKWQRSPQVKGTLYCHKCNLYPVSETCRVLRNIDRVAIASFNGCADGLAYFEGSEAILAAA